MRARVCDTVALVCVVGCGKSVLVVKFWAVGVTDDAVFRNMWVFLPKNNKRQKWKNSR